MPRITPNLWFDTEGLEAARVLRLDLPQLRDHGHHPLRRGRPCAKRDGADSRVPARRPGVHGHQRGAGVHLRRGDLAPHQLRRPGEVDYYWEKLSEGGEEGPCGWLKDKFGLSWQVVPAGMVEMLNDPDQERAARHEGDARHEEARPRRAAGRRRRRVGQAARQATPPGADCSRAARCEAVAGERVRRRARRRWSLRADCSGATKRSRGVSPPAPRRPEVVATPAETITPCTDGLVVAQRSAAEVQAQGTGTDVWALVTPLIPGSASSKVVWKVRSGSSLPKLKVFDPAGRVVPLSFGPDLHGASTWTRLGDEYGSGWERTGPGCWTVVLSQDGVEAALHLVYAAWIANTIVPDR